MRKSLIQPNSQNCLWSWKCPYWGHLSQVQILTHSKWFLQLYRKRESMHCGLSAIEKLENCCCGLHLTQCFHDTKSLITNIWIHVSKLVSQWFYHFKPSHSSKPTANMGLRFYFRFHTWLPQAAIGWNTNWVKVDWIARIKCQINTGKGMWQNRLMKAFSCWLSTGTLQGEEPN